MSPIRPANVGNGEKHLGRMWEGKTRHYADGTYLTTTGPWGVYTGGAALCPDGKVRKLKRIAITADTYFSVPAYMAVRKNGKVLTVAGFVTFKTRSGLSTETPEDPTVCYFFPYEYRKNKGAFE